MSEKDYLEIETESETKHEFIDGHVYDWPGYDFNAQGLAGTTRTHNQLQISFVAAVRAAARAAGCQVYGSDMRLRVRQGTTRRYYYPDAMVVCDGEIQEAYGDDELHVTRPCIIVEILSERSVRIDHTEKLQVYQAIASVQAYLIVHQQPHRVEDYRRADDGLWQPPALLGDADSIDLPCIRQSLKVAELYV